ncbi:hypothetical protein PROFUN_02094 [Planoprotostelium fungivorum]|uniref:Uncharacterized protein n=1 Tax=Planoprotostelium fungivorum TaxID=1890364 RepID=A0A2P6NZ42_9EUKA|nr:hypothetical protein PROFUN_02094 [Planoprotostelium fungivorum]
MSKVWITVAYTKKIAYIGTFLCYERPDEKTKYTTVIINDLLPSLTFPPPRRRGHTLICSMQQSNLSRSPQPVEIEDEEINFSE